MNGEGAMEAEAAPERGGARRSGVRCGRPPRELKGRVDERILDAAGKVFLERGFSGASVDEIAEVAGAGKPTIYARFSSKEALFTAVMERLVRQNTSLEAIPCAGVSIEDCPASWRARWAEFWGQALPRFDHVLMWSAPKDVVALVPPEYAVVFQRDELTIFERRTSR